MRPEAPGALAPGFFMPAEKVVFLIDGFNLYHSIKEDPRLRPLRWLDIPGLAASLVRKNQELAGIYYFTALALWDPEKVARHKRLIRVLEDRGVTVVFGKFKAKDESCRLCRKSYTTSEEKRTDVNIAVTLFRLAMEDRYSTAIMVSGDTDLVPAVEAVRECFPTKRIGVAFPPRRTNRELLNAATFHIQLKAENLLPWRFPDSVRLKGGTEITCPEKWRQSQQGPDTGHSRT